MKRPFTLPVRDRAEDEEDTDLPVPENAIPPSDDSSFEDDDDK